MTKQAAVKAIVIVAVAEVIVALAIRWLASTAPAFRAERQVTAPAAIQRLAEMHADAAVPALVAGDHAALAEVIAPSSQWPEIVYVSVENAQGRILAHSDPTQAGRVWNSRVAAAIRATVKADYEEVVAPVVSAPAGDRGGTRVGQVRLGYVVDAITSRVGETRAQPLDLWLVLGLAGLVAVPAGLLVARMTTAPPPEADGDWPVEEPVRAADEEPEPVRERVSALHAETERLRRKLEERSRRLDERNRELDQHTLDLAEARAALATHAADAEELHRAIAAHVDEIEALRQENADWQAVVRRLRAELDERAATLSEASLAAPADPTEARAPSRIEPDGEGLPAPARDAVRQLVGRAIEHIAHVLRGSLTNVLGFSKLLLRQTDGPLNETQAASVTNIQDAGLRLLTFVTALAEYARAEAGTAECRPESVELGALLEDVVSELDRSGAADAVTVDAPPQAVTVRADRSHLRRILSVLLQPAPSPPGDGEVSLTVRPEPGTVELAVAHPRWALTPAERSSLFEPFAADNGQAPRLDDARVRLALVRSLALLNRGDLRLEGGEDAGVLFMLRIPTDAAP